MGQFSSREPRSGGRQIDAQQSVAGFDVSLTVWVRARVLIHAADKEVAVFKPPRSFCASAIVTRMG